MDQALSKVLGHRGSSPDFCPHAVRTGEVVGSDVGLNSVVHRVLSQSFI